jgi:hypothetical protein
VEDDAVLVVAAETVAPRHVRMRRMIMPICIIRGIGNLLCEEIIGIP